MSHPKRLELEGEITLDGVIRPNHVQMVFHYGDVEHGRSEAAVLDYDDVLRVHRWLGRWLIDENQVRNKRAEQALKYAPDPT